MPKTKVTKMDQETTDASSDAKVVTNETKTDKKAAAEGGTADENEAPKTSTQNKSKAKKLPKPEASIPRGQPKSNRPWKTPKQKFSKIKKTINRLSFEKKMELRNEMRYIKEKSKEIKDQRKEAAVQRHQRRVENAERRLANERRSEVVQVIKNPAKLKRMKKKQMRMIEKRDLSQVKVV